MTASNTAMDKPTMSAWELRQFLGGISLDTLVDRVALGRLPVPEVDPPFVWWETEKFLAGQDSTVSRHEACRVLRRLARPYPKHKPTTKRMQHHEFGRTV